MTKQISLPSDWVEYNPGETTVYAEFVGGEPVVRFIHASDYFGGDHMEKIYRVEEDSLIEEFSGLGRYEKAVDVLQDRINRS